MAGARVIPGLTAAVAVAAILADCTPAQTPAGASPAGAGPQGASTHGVSTHGVSPPGVSTAGAARSHAADGRVTGRFVREGGPMRPGGRQPAVVPLAGTITFRATSGDWLRHARVGKSGRFSVALPPGRFTISGRSPALAEQGGSSDPPCSAPLTVRVIGGHTTAARVVCPVP